MRWYEQRRWALAGVFAALVFMNAGRVGLWWCLAGALLGALAGGALVLHRHQSSARGQRTVASAVIPPRPDAPPPPPPASGGPREGCRATAKEEDR